MTLLSLIAAAWFLCRHRPRLRLLLAASLVAVSLSVSTGCSWFKLPRGEGFQEWSSEMGGSLRGNKKDAKASAYFFDRRAEEIEKNLGGGF